MKKIVFIGLGIILIFGLVIFLAKHNKNIESKEEEKTILKVKTQNAKDFSSVSQKIQYPAVVVGDQQVTVKANVSGIVSSLNFDLGDSVFQGKRMAVIDEINGNYDQRSLELDVQSSEQRYKLAKDNYKDDDSYANKKAKEIAKISLESAQLNLEKSIRNHSITAPISGKVVQRFVSQGDSVNAGQPIFSVSKTNAKKIQFFVNQEELNDFKTGKEIIISNNGKEISGTVSKVSPEADFVTRRILVEVSLKDENDLLIGSVVNVLAEIERKPQNSENLLLPLSVVTISQNESYIFVMENNRAKKVLVSVVKVQGEFVEIKTDISSSSLVITNGSKLVRDGEEVVVEK